MAKQGAREGVHLAAAHDCICLAELFQALGRLTEAQNQYEQAVRITQAVEDAAPDDRAAKNGRFLAARGLGQVQLALHNPAQARQSAHAALEAADPNNPALKRDAAFCQLLIAEASVALRDWPAARAAADQRLALVQTWAKADSPNVRDRLDLANVWIDRGDVEQRDRDYAEAVKWFDRALAVLTPLEQEGKLRPFPDELSRLTLLKTVTADDHSILKSIDDINVALEDMSERSQRLLVGRAALLARMGRPADAAATTEKLRELNPQDGGNLYNVACCYALCIPAVGRGKSADDLSAEEKAARAGYATQAIKALRAAFDHGFHNIEHLENDPDLDVLHTEADYRSLIDELKGLRLRLWLTFPVLP
jgi:tetratricopeptide (TPR) repeat protein